MSEQIPVPQIGGIPLDYFAAGANVVTGQLAQILNEIPSTPGVNSRVVLFDSVDFVAGDEQEVRFVWRGLDGTITNIDAVADGQTDGTVTITASIEGDPVTGGVATIPLSAAAGGVGAATPTAANVITAGQRLLLVVGGTNTLVTLGEIGVWFTY